ncbi:hypothetical protein ACFXJ8_32255 [Nonomuraea sp. NPDC059194]
MPEAGTSCSQPGVPATTRRSSLPSQTQVNGVIATTLSATAAW